MLKIGYLGIVVQAGFGARGCSEEYWFEDSFDWNTHNSMHAED